MENNKQENCNTCGKTLREQMKGCAEISCYRQFLKQENTIEEVAKKFLIKELELSNFQISTLYSGYVNAVVKFHKEQQERMYSEEEWLNVLLIFAEWYNSSEIIKPRSLILKDDVQVFISEQFKNK